MVEAWYTYNAPLVYHSLHRKEAIFLSKNASGLGSLTYTIRNGKKYWTGRITIGQDIHGKQIRKSFSSYKKSDVVENMKKASMFSSVSGVVDTNNPTLGSFLNHWLFNIKSQEIKSSSLARYDQCLRLRVLPYPYANTKLSDINIQNLQKFITFLVKDEKWPEETVKITAQMISSCLDYSIILGRRQTNPGKYVKVPKEQKLERPDKYRIFSKQEQDQLLANMNLEDVVERMLYFDFFTGLRRNELRAIQVGSYTAPILTVDKQLARTYVFEETGRSLSKNTLTPLKTSSSNRSIPLPQIATKILEDSIERSEKAHERIEKKFKDDAFVFVDDLCRPIEEKRLNRRLQTLCTKIGITPRPLHSIRHSYATRLFEAGVDIKTVQELLGHSDYKTTVDIYTHVMPEKKLDAVSVFDELY